MIGLAALTSTWRRSLFVIGPLPVDRFAHRIELTRPIGLADLHVHDWRGSLDRLAFLGSRVRCRHLRCPTLSVRD